MFSFQAIHNLLWIKHTLNYSCLSIMSMFSFQAIHNILEPSHTPRIVVYRLCQCSLFKQFTTEFFLQPSLSGCLSIMSMFSFQAIHNPKWRTSTKSPVVYRLCQCSLFKQFTTGILLQGAEVVLFIDYVNVLFSSNSQLYGGSTERQHSCLSIMSMFSFQAIHNCVF